MSMRWYYCTSFTGHYPVGVSALARGNSPVEAATALNLELTRMGLPGDALVKDMRPLNTDNPVIVLQDGDY